MNKFLTFNTKKILLYASLILPIVSFAQHQYRLDVNSTSFKEGDKVYLVFNVDDKQITDSTLIRNGAFSFNGNLKYPVLSRLFLNKNPYVVNLAKGEKIDYLMFYLEPRNIKMMGKDSLATMKISRSPENDAYADLKLMLKQNNKQFADLRKEYELLPKEKQKDSLVLAGFIAREEQLMSDAYRVHLAIANKYTKLHVGLISLAHIASQPDLAQQVLGVYQKLPVALKESPMGRGIPDAVNANINTKIGAVALDFVQNDPSGKKIKLSDLKGKYLLIDFWASWCGPCRKENPNLVSLYQKFNGQGFEILGVSLDQPGQYTNWVKAIKDDNLSWQQVSDLKGWDNEVARKYGVRSIPTSFLLDPNGKIIAKDLRGVELAKKLEEIFSSK
jgi:peroxiredoxin